MANASQYIFSKLRKTLNSTAGGPAGQGTESCWDRSPDQDLDGGPPTRMGWGGAEGGR